MISVLVSRLVLLVFGTLYPAYASYKTVKTKNVRDYVKWMMYWIVFAAYTFIEIFTDIFLSFWFPFYYELKIIILLWLVCPTTKGSTYIFRKVVNRQLNKYEVLIDSHVAALWDHGYDLMRKIGSRGMDYFIEIVLELFRKGHITINNLVPQVPNNSENIQVLQEDHKDSVSDPNALDDFIMTDNSEVDEIIPTKSSEMLNDSCSESDVFPCEEIKSSKARPLKVKNKKVSLRERKRASKDSIK